MESKIFSVKDLAKELKVPCGNLYQKIWNFETEKGIDIPRNKRGKLLLDEDLYGKIKSYIIEHSWKEVSE